MRKKLFTFLLALTASIGMMWAETVVVINKSEFTSSGVTKEGVTLALSSGSMTSSDVEAMNGSFEFSTSLGKFTGITIETDANIMEIYEGAFTSAGWPTGDNLGTSAVWTGESETVLISCVVAGMDNITITCTIEPTPTPATGLQVVEVTSDIYDGWNSNSNTFTVDALPGFQAVTFDEAKVWTGVPTSGTAVLVYRTNGDNARVIQFFDGTIMDDYDIEVDFNQIYENITISGNRFFYTAGGGSTPTPTEEQVPTNADPGNPSYHYSTFFHSTQNYKLTNDGTQAFIADLSGSDLVLTEIANGTQVIPANTAVILRKTGSADPVVLTPTEENGVSVNPDNNSLEGVDDETAITSIDGLTATNCYVLSGTNEHGVGFYRINSGNLKAHKAYVKYAGLQNNAPKRMRFIFGQTTDIENVQGDKVQSTKLMENGVLYIIKNGVKYNAQGQIVK